MNMTINKFKSIVNSDKVLFKFLDELKSYPQLKAQYQNDLTSIYLSTEHLTKKDIKRKKAEAKEKYKLECEKLKAFQDSIKECANEITNGKISNSEINKLTDFEKRVNETQKIINEIVNKRGSKCYKYFLSDIKKYEQLGEKPILYVRNLTKYYKSKKTPTISALNFNVYPGEFHAFIGANGAGKTTTIKCLITSYYNWSGTILINGKKNETEAAKKNIGYIPEKASFPECFSTFSYLKWMVMLSGLKEKEASELVTKQLKDLKMWNLRQRSPNTFSSGQKKKILLAQSLVHDPDIIVMDEPVANLDPKARIEFFDTLLELRKQGKAIFVSSHVLAELDIYADSLTILDGGKIIYSGKKQELLEKYNVNEYLIRVSQKDNNKLLDIAKRMKISSSYDEEKKCNIFKIVKISDVTKLQKTLISKNIYVDLFQRNYPSLNDIYEDMIIFCSTDTMRETNPSKLEIK